MFLLFLRFFPPSLVQSVHWVVSPLWGSVGAAVQITVTILLWQGLHSSLRDTYGGYLNCFFYRALSIHTQCIYGSCFLLPAAVEMIHHILSNFNSVQETVQISTASILDFTIILYWHDVWSGPPEPPVQCNTSLGPQRSLDLVCSPGFDGGLPQEFRAILVNKNINKVIINKTAIIPSFSFPGKSIFRNDERRVGFVNHLFKPFDLIESFKCWSCCCCSS